MPEVIEFPTDVTGLNAYAYFYPPTNPIYQGYPEEKPPLLLKSHGAFWFFCVCVCVRMRFILQSFYLC